MTAVRLVCQRINPQILLAEFSWLSSFWCLRFSKRGALLTVVAVMPGSNSAWLLRSSQIFSALTAATAIKKGREELFSN